MNHNPSEFFYALHEIQHKASLHPDKISKEFFLQFLETAHTILVNQSFTTNLYRISGFSLLSLLQTLIVTNPCLIDDDVVHVSNKIWKIDEISNLLQDSTLDSTTDDEIEEKSQNFNKKRASKNIFFNLISARLILQLDESPMIDTSLKCLLNWLKSLIHSQLLTIDRLSAMFVSLFQYEWNKKNLDKIRYLSKNVSVNKFLDHEDDNDDKSSLFLDLVADLATNLEI